MNGKQTKCQKQSKEMEHHGIRSKKRWNHYTCETTTFVKHVLVYSDVGCSVRLYQGKDMNSLLIYVDYSNLRIPSLIIRTQFSAFLRTVEMLNTLLAINLLYCFLDCLFSWLWVNPLVIISSQGQDLANISNPLQNGWMDHHELGPY